jgi:hypothetical protein
LAQPNPQTSRTGVKTLLVSLAIANLSSVVTGDGAMGLAERSGMMLEWYPAAMLYDVFICHASEDKESFVRPLALALRDRHVEVWYDEFTLTLGDSIRRAIDKGLAQSRFGIVVLSHAFFSKKWPQHELDGLIDRELLAGEKVVLTVWHRVGHEDVAAYSPSLAGKWAVPTANGLAAVVAEILKVVKPEGSPLLIARDFVNSFGVNTPVVTDSYWLVVAEASNRLATAGAAIPEDASWGRWAFPLPHTGTSQQEWGERLGWAALQLKWTTDAEDEAICITTRPSKVLDFIRSHPGLSEMCESMPALTAEYAPQLTIPGFGGELEPLFEGAYQESLLRHAQLAACGSNASRALTVDGQVPACDEEWCLRHPNLGFYRPVTISEAYFHGGIFGPEVAHFDGADHLFWLLSDESTWLPPYIRTTLLDGYASWLPRWQWLDHHGELWPTAGEACLALHRARRPNTYRWTHRVIDDWKNRIALAKTSMGLPEPVDVLFERLKAENVVEKAIQGGLNVSASRETSNRRHAQ